MPSRQLSELVRPEAGLSCGFGIAWGGYNWYRLYLLIFFFCCELKILKDPARRFSRLHGTQARAQYA